MQFTFGDKGEVYLQDKSALPVTKKEGMGEGKTASALGWNIDTQTLVYAAPSICMWAKWIKVCVPLTCSQNLTACIVMSQQCHFAEGLSNKKAESYYSDTWQIFASVEVVDFTAGFDILPTAFLFRGTGSWTPPRSSAAVPSPSTQNSEKKMIARSE